MAAGVMLVAACGGESLVPLPSKFEAVVAGGIHSCGIVTDGALFCWGNNDYGQLGDGSRKSHIYPTAVVGTVRFTEVTGGGGHTCGIATTGAAYCWGANNLGQLGGGAAPDRATPGQVSGTLTWLQLSAGGAYTCGIATDSLAYCWGWNGVGQLGDGTDTDQAAPVAVSGGRKFRSISAGVHHTCGLANTGEVFCWGLNEFGQLGTGTMDDSSVPVLVGGGVTWVAVSAGYAHTCGVAANGAGLCWGRNHYGQLGVGDTVSAGNQLSPFPMAGGLTWSSLDLGAYFSCGTAAQPAGAYCWGYNGSWQLGVDLPSTGCVDENGLSSQCVASPTAVSGTVAFASISAHTQHTCGLGADGFAYCWGSGSEGQLGTGDKGEGVYTFEPLRVAGQP